jgi:signal peptide peptidase SppA
MDAIVLNENPAGLGIAHLDQFFGVWAMAEPQFNALAGRIGALDLAAHVAASGARRPAAASDYDVTDDGVAVIQIHDTLTKYGSSMTGGGTIEMRRQVRAAARDGAIKAIVLHVDSPGGTVSGTRDLAQEVAAARAAKPTFAFIEDLGASAAYWIASQADKVFVNDTGLVGSIGTFAVIHDTSGAAGQMGIKVHVIRAGEFKGAGTPGTPVTEGLLAESQRVVDELNGHFLQGVAAGRRMPMEKVIALADGRVHVGAAAVAAGLADGVKSFDEVLSEGARAGKSKSPIRAEDENPPAIAGENIDTQEGKHMAEEIEKTEPGPAGYAELKEALVGADAAFVCAQMDAGATVAQASAAWITEQNRRIEAERAKAAKPGVEALGSGPAKPTAAVADDPIAAWNAKIEAKLAARKSRERAVIEADQENPGLREAMLAAWNASHK